MANASYLKIRKLEKFSKVMHVRLFGLLYADFSGPDSGPLMCLVLIFSENIA